MYDGTHYHGWQIQPNSITIQQILNEKISMLTKQNVSVLGSGRTDTGVHAYQQFAHVDLIGEINLNDLCYKLNKVLPYDISVRSIKKVKNDAHARFDAVSRTYHYKITKIKNPFSHLHEFHYWKDLNIKEIQKATTFLLTQSDFASFTKSHHDATNTLCNLSHCEWKVIENGYQFEITSNRFLRNMVRAIVGTLIELGAGMISYDDFVKAVEQKDRREAGFSAEACGLYLYHVSYPDSIWLST